VNAKTGKRARGSRCRLLLQSADTLRWGADRRLTSPRHQSMVLYGSPATLVLGLQRTIVAPTSVTGAGLFCPCFITGGRVPQAAVDHSFWNE
jgi:hypothetical protein